jgi:hypothetical protein
MNTTGNNIQGLKAAFDARKSYFANRSSCIFPVHLRTNTDLHIVYLNYWTLKNGIERDTIVVNFRVYDSMGNPVLKISTEIGETHNQVSIRTLLGEKTHCDINHFDGMVEVEILSLKNIQFPFPGMVGIYQAGDLFSAVHAAGRIKNADEAQRVIYTNESNWTCKSGPSITAFFHYFNGPTLPQKKTICIKLRNRTGTVADQREVSIAHLPPFGSQIFFAADIFPESVIENDAFISVELEHNSVFPRMVVGNYFRDSNFLEVTHSFPLIEKEDYCPVQPGAEFQSILPAYTSEDLTLNVHVFPTNNPGVFSAVAAIQSFADSLLQPDEAFVQYQGESSAPITYQLEPTQKFWCLRMKGPKVPSRFNASYRYRVKGVPSRYSTDIADGADSCVYPPKYRHWGYGYLGNNFETLVLIRNNTHQPATTKSGSGILRVFGLDNEVPIPVTINAEAATSLNLSKHISYSTFEGNDGPQFLSWMLEMDVPTCETFWIVYRKRDGAIMGDHGL